MSQPMLAAGIRAALNIFQRWQLTDAQAAVLLGVSIRTIRQQAAIQSDTLRVRDQESQLDRVGLILGIYKDLHTLFPDEVQADRWVLRSNHAPLFGGRTAIDVMLESIAGMIRVRNYLAAQAG